MTTLTVAISTVADGSMFNRHDHHDERIITNRERWLAQHHITLDQTTRLDVNANQRDKELHETNWCQYKEVARTDKGHGMSGDDIFVADSIITRDLDHALFLPVADCVGAIFYDPTNKILMLSHLGRHSLEQQGGEKSVAHLVQHYGSDPTDILVWLTPAPSKESYPIWALDNKGMKEVMFEQLATAGIRKEHITDNPTETDKDPAYFSYSEYLQDRRAEDGDHAIVAMMTA